MTAPGRADGTLTGPRMVGIPRAGKQLHASLRLSSRVQRSHKLERGAPTVTRLGQVTSSTKVQENRWAALLGSRLLTELELAFVPRVAAITGRAGHVNCVRLQAVSHALILFRTCPA